MSITNASIAAAIKKDPFVYNLFNNDSLSDFNPSRAVNWIKIPTSYVKEGGKESSISMMSVYTYSGLESIYIQAAIKDPNEIVFSDDGHVACTFKGKTSAQHFFPNPLISENTSGTSRPTGIANTVGSQMQNFAGTFYFNDQFLFSKNLRWILYKVPNIYYKQLKPGVASSFVFTKDKSAKPWTAPVYALLYNPLHRKNFQDIYADIINLTGNPFSTQSFIGANTSYMTVIKKYCNAFTVPKYPSPATGKTLVHYADPSCTIAFDTNVGKICQALSFNITQESLKTEYYHGGINGYNAAVRSLNAISTSDAYCSRGSGGGPPRFLRDKAKVIMAREATNSFMQILTNYFIGASGDDGATMPSGWNSKQPGNTLVGATCAPQKLSITQCPITISAAGNLTLNNTKVSAVCGNSKPPAPASPSKKPTGKTASGSPSGSPSSKPSGSPSGSPSSKPSGSPPGSPSSKPSGSDSDATPAQRLQKLLTGPNGKMYMGIIAAVILVLILLGFFLFHK